MCLPIERVLLMATKGSAASAEAIADKYREATDLAVRLRTTLGDLERLITSGERDADEKTPNVVASRGAVSLVASTLALGSSDWRSYAAARNRR
jgi:hypothetical protein